MSILSSAIIIVVVLLLPGLTTTNAIAMLGNSFMVILLSIKIKRHSYVISVALDRGAGVGGYA
jgi:4-hydroxybenzoate polyprenyltransferase